MASQPTENTDQPKKSFRDIPRSELLPDALKDPLLSLKDEKTGELLPVVLAEGVMDGSKHAVLAQDSNGNKFIGIDERYHKWTPEYVQDVLRSSDAKISAEFSSIETYRERLDSGKVDGISGDAIPKALQRLDALTAYMRESAEQQGIGEVSICTASGLQEFRKGAALVSREGTQYVVFKEDTLQRALTSEPIFSELKAVADHELAHLKNGDLTTRQSDIHNAHREKLTELTADMAIRAPEAGASMLKRDLQEFSLPYGVIANAQRGVETSPQLVRDAERDPSHPLLTERIAAQEMRAALTQWCNAIAIKPDPHKCNEMASEQILELYKKGNLPEPSFMKPLPGFEGISPQQLMSLPMDDVSSHTKPSAAPVAPSQVKRR